jgi:hypothetical protein
MTDAKTVIENINRFNQLSVVFLVLAIVLMVLSVVLWHKLRISNSIRVLTGFGSGKAVAKLQADTEKDGVHQTEAFNKVAPVITWSSITGQTTGEMDKKQISAEMPQQNGQISADLNLNMNIDLSINKNMAASSFVIEQDIVYTGLSQVISA